MKEALERWYGDFVEREWPQLYERGDFSHTSGLDLDVATLQHATDIRFICSATLQALDCRRLVTKGFKERIWERFSLKRLPGQQGYGFFNFYGVHSTGLIIFGYCDDSDHCLLSTEIIFFGDTTAIGLRRNPLVSRDTR